MAFQAATSLAHSSQGTSTWRGESRSNSQEAANAFTPTRTRVFLEVQRLLEETVIDLCRSQHLDLRDRTDRPSLKQYLEMVRLKTGVLLGAACETGALVAGATNHRALARKFGEALGVGSQLRDDYLGAWGNPQEMGKGADDLKDGKWSLPVLVGARLDSAGGNVPTAIDWMVEEWTRRARGHLSGMELPLRWLEMFVELTERLSGRVA